MGVAVASTNSLGDLLLVAIAVHGIYESFFCIYLKGCAQQFPSYNTLSSSSLYLDTFPVVMFYELINQSKFGLSPGMIRNESLINQRTHNTK